jgi:NTP pyrophosphatase (non-canonical NTP hydrolase)
MREEKVIPGAIDADDAAIIADGLELLMRRIHKANEKWWHDLHTGEPKKRNVGEMLMLAVSELSEAMEGHRKDLMDDKLPHRKMFEVELADTCIRIFDMAQGLGIDLVGAIIEKHAFNQHRPDHKPEARLAPGGKAY